MNTQFCRQGNTPNTLLNQFSSSLHLQTPRNHVSLMHKLRPKDLRNYDWSEWSQNELDWNRFQIQQKV